MRPAKPPDYLLYASPLQMLDQLFGDRRAILHAGLVTGALAQVLEGLSLFQQGEGRLSVRSSGEASTRSMLYRSTAAMRKQSTTP
jgi:hypothetical protein